MKKVMSRVLAVIICLAIVMESQSVNVWGEETFIDEQISAEYASDDFADDPYIYENELINKKNTDDVANISNNDVATDDSREEISLSTNGTSNTEKEYIPNDGIVDGIYYPYEGASYYFVYEILENGCVCIRGINGSVTNSFEIPSSIEGHTVTEIGGYAFYQDTHNGRHIEGNLVLPEGLKVIGNKAFAGCKGLTGDLVIPDNVTEIGENAFGGCTGFNGKLVLSKNLKSIPNEAFYNCTGFTGSITIPESVRDIGYSAFYNCSSFSGDLVIPDNVESLGFYAFEGCKGLDGKLTISNNLTIIDSDTFANCSSLKGNLIIPDGIKKIGWGAFSNCSGLTGNLTVPAKVNEIVNSAFEGCTGFDGDLSLPTGLLTIGPKAFKGCCNLKGDINLPDTLTTIGEEAFSGCEKLTGDVIIPEGVTAIEKATFYYCSNLDGELSLPKTLESIGQDAFINCTKLHGNLTIPSKVTNIGTQAFRSCSGFSGDLNIPDSVTELGWAAFYECTGFNGQLTISKGLSELNGSEFSGCTNLTGSLSIPSNIKVIGSGSFLGCSNLKGKLILPNNVTSIGYGTFENCEGLTGELELPNSIVKIDPYAFNNCSFSGSLIIPSTISEIGEYTFADNKFSGDLTIPGNIKKIGHKAFDNNSFSGDLIMEYGVEEIYWDAFDFYPYHFDNIYIPSSINAIEDGLGPQQSDTILYCVPGSYAYEWGEEKHFTVVPWDDGSGSFDPSKTVTSIELNPSELELHVGNSSSIRIKTDTGIVPVDRATVTNSDDTVASVEAKLDAGKLQITALSVGETEVKVLIDGIEANAIIHVLKPAGDFTITYILNGGTNSSSNVTVFNKNNPTIKLYPATRKGYDFVGWYTTANYTGKAIKSIPKNANKNYVLYAKWKAKSYKLAYKSPINCINPNLKVYSADSTYVLFNAIAPGYAFQGWYTDEDYTHKIEEISVGTYGNITLYAKWKGATYTVKYDGNGATSGSAANTTHDYKTGATKLSDGGSFYRKGYHISGWKLKANGNKANYALSAKVNNLSSVDGDVVTLYAHWMPNSYTVKYDSNASVTSTISGNTKNTSHVYDKQSKVSKCGFKRVGYVFKEWNTKADGSGTKYDASEKVLNLTEEHKGTVTFYAMWRPIKYQITFNKGAKDANGSMDAITATYDKPIDLPSNKFTRNGYRFGFWQTSSKYNGKYWYYRDEETGMVPNLITKENGKFQLQPVWLYDVNLDPNGGNGDIKTIQFEADKAQALPANEFVRAGYTFVGWAETKDGKVKYKDKASIKNLANKTLYAIWGPNNYDIFITADGKSKKIMTVAIGKTCDLSKQNKTYTKLGKAFLGWKALRGMSEEWDEFDGSKIIMNEAFIDQHAIGKNIMFAPWDEDINFINSDIYVKPGNVIDMNTMLNHSVEGINGYTWKSSDTGIAVFKNKKKPAELTILKDGEAEISLQWKNNNKTEKIAIKIKVTSQPIGEKILNAAKAEWNKYKGENPGSDGGGGLLSEKTYVANGSPYGGVNPWCGAFVSKCLIGAGIIKEISGSAAIGRDLVETEKIARFLKDDENPEPGDIIEYYLEGDTKPYLHAAIFAGYENGVMMSFQGNVAQKWAYMPVYNYIGYTETQLRYVYSNEYTVKFVRIEKKLDN